MNILRELREFLINVTILVTIIRSVHGIASLFPAPTKMTTDETTLKPAQSIYFVPGSEQPEQTQLEYLQTLDNLKRVGPIELYMRYPTK